MNLLKVTLIAAAAMCTATSASGQLMGERINLDFIKDAVQPNVGIVCTSYVVSDPTYTNFFANGDDSVFNRVYSIALRVDGGFLVTDQAINPWNNDPLFQTLDTNAYRPVVADRTICPAGMPDAVYQKLTFDDEFGDTEPAGLGDESYSIQLFPTTASAGFDATQFFNSELDNQAKGLALWYTQLPDVNIGSNTALNVKIVPADLAFDMQTGMADINAPKSQGHIIGGVVVTPVAMPDATLQFRLVGIILPPKGPNQPWRVAHASLSEPAAGDEAAPADNVTDYDL